MIRVAVVDDQELVRSGFVVLLRSSPGIEVVGEAGDGGVDQGRKAPPGTADATGLSAPSAATEETPNT